MTFLLQLAVCGHPSVSFSTLQRLDMNQCVFPQQISSAAYGHTVAVKHIFRSFKQTSETSTEAGWEGEKGGKKHCQWYGNFLEVGFVLI